MPRLSEPNTIGTFYTTATVFTVKMAYHYGNHRCHIEKNFHIAFILPCRWQDGVESRGIETTWQASDSLEL